MRVGEKYKKGLRLGLKIAGAGAVVAGGVRIASKSGDPNQPMVGSFSPLAYNPPVASRKEGLPTLVGKTSQMAGQSADFASMASQLAQQQRSKSKFGFF